MFNIPLSKYNKYQHTPKLYLQTLSMKQRLHLNIRYVPFNTYLTKNKSDLRKMVI